MSTEQLEPTYTAEEQKQLRSIENTARIVANALEFLSKKTQVNATEARPLLECCDLINNMLESTKQSVQKIQNDAVARTRQAANKIQAVPQETKNVPKRAPVSKKA